MEGMSLVDTAVKAVIAGCRHCRIEATGYYPGLMVRSRKPEVKIIRFILPEEVRDPMLIECHVVYVFSRRF
jgi:hypothetical protein